MTSTQCKQSIDTCGIEKYEGSYDQDELGVTQIPTETILQIKNFTLLAIYTFLASRPSTWKLNAKHLAIHFDCNKEKIYKALELLIVMGFITRTQIRDKGKFVRYHYRLHLRQIVRVAPCPEKPYTVKPDTENPDTYKTNILPLENKESITTTTEKQKPSSSFESDVLNQKLPRDPRSDEIFLENVFHHMEHNSDSKLNIHRKRKGILVILKKLNLLNELFSSDGFIDQETKNKKEIDEKKKEYEFLIAQEEQHIKRINEYKKATKRNAQG